MSGVPANWNPPKLTGDSNTIARYVIWNFGSMKSVTITGATELAGTVLLPEGALNQQGGGNLIGGIYAASFVHGGGGEALLGEHPRGTPAEVAICIGEKSVSILTKEDGGEWESIAEFPRAGFPGIPAAIRYGKLGPGWNSGDFGDPGPTHPCRVEWTRLY